MSSSGNLKLNLLFLVTILRLDLMSKTMAKPQEQIVSGETVLVRDGEPISSTVVYLDESSLSAYSATSTIDTNHYQRPNNDGNTSGLGVREARKDESADGDVEKGTESASESTSESGQPSQIDHQAEHNKSTPGSTTSRPVSQLPTGRPWGRDEWLAKEYFSYLCGTFDFVSSLASDHWSDAFRLVF